MHASEIGLTSGWLVGAVAVLAGVMVVLVPWRWDAWRRRRTGRSASTLAAVVAVLLACALAVNSLGSFFPTVGTLIGTSANPGEGTQAEAGPDGRFLASTAPLAAARAAAGHGTTVHATVLGDRSGITRDVDVYLPAAYSDPALANTRFPVTEWFPGFPGEPRELASLFGLPDLLDAAIAAHRMPPTVVVIPDISGEPRLVQDQECVDAVDGPADDTFLSADVRDWTSQQFRVRSSRGSWSLAGWSTGGYCALNLALRHPQSYGAAASLSGYDRTADDVTTGNLFRDRDDVRRANDVSVLLHEHPAPTAILLAAGVGEADEQAAIARMRAAAVPPVQIDTVNYPGGGHNATAVHAELPAVLDWLGQQLPPPIAPGDTPATPGDPAVRPWPLPSVPSGRG